jgi:hypothetical protein
VIRSSTREATGFRATGGSGERQLLRRTFDTFVVVLTLAAGGPGRVAGHASSFHEATYSVMRAAGTPIAP